MFGSFNPSVSWRSCGHRSSSSRKIMRRIGLLRALNSTAIVSSSTHFETCQKC